MKLAYFSPFNPQPSGISDYSEELLPYLAARADIDLFVDGFKPDNKELMDNFQIFNYRTHPDTLKGLRSYDAIIYHMGNDHRYHTGIVRVMREHPGVVVFHDFALQDFFLGQAREQNDPRCYLDELEVCNGRSERAKAEEYFHRGATPPQAATPLAFPLNAGLARSAEGLIVHSEWSRERFAAMAPGVPIAHVNHHITAQAAARGSSTSDSTETRVWIASFGLITPDKGIERALRVLATLRAEFDFHYNLVGPAGNFPDLAQIIQRYGLTDRVTVTGHVPLAEFVDRIAETDIAINLRERPVGATSGSLCRIMASGIPAIVSNVGAFSELPNTAVVKIDHDQHADSLLAEYLRELIQNPKLRKQIGRNARNHVRAHHRIENSAEQYLNFVREVIARRPRKHLVSHVAHELSQLGFRANDDALLRGVAAEVALLAPTGELSSVLLRNESAEIPDQFSSDSGVSGNGRESNGSKMTKPAGRLPKIEGLDYKRAAVDYPNRLDAERSYYLRTKPFYNLANKPDKHTGDGMDPETHRHFSDFANMAVALALPAGATILDVGCGSGWLSEYFARLGYVVTGIDISDDLVQMARERVERTPYNVDHQTQLNCRFLTHDVESAPLAEQFDAIICYDSLHHFVDEHAVMRHLSKMVSRGGLLFILEGDKPDEGSATEEELVGVMREFATLESPYHPEYLRELVVEHGFSVIGDYVSANGLFERDTVADGRVAVDLEPINYLLCKKVVDGITSTADVPDSRAPGQLAARIDAVGTPPSAVAAGSEVSLKLRIENVGDTIWLTGPATRKGAVMLGVKVLDGGGSVLSERHGEPKLPRALAPGEAVEVSIGFCAPAAKGSYQLKVDLVAQHVAWFERQGSQPLLLPFLSD